MATPERTQKELSGRYQGDVDYYNRPHPWRVARFCATFVAIVGGIAAIFVYKNRIERKVASENFFSPGKISSSHATLAEGCAGCHGRSAVVGNEVTPAKFGSDLKERFRHGIDFSRIDGNCQACHEGKPPFKPKPDFAPPKNYKLHEPNVVEDRTCSICHREHLGPGRMEKVADWHCASCHNDRGIMKASAELGKTLPPAAFHLRPHPPQQIVFNLPRPVDGYTQNFPAFDSRLPGRDHPEFQLVRENRLDPNGAASRALAAEDPEKAILRFNHRLHMGETIPPYEENRKLDCKYCHTPDPEGRFYQRVNFEANCKACHALQFDKNNPQLHVPHEDVNLVRNFLRTLPAQYGDFARLNQKIKGDREVQSFVAQQIKLLRGQFGVDGFALEHDVFFETSPYKAQRNNPDGRTRANFVGCAYCHRVKEVPNAAPDLTKPILVDRWMPQARFNHAKHTKVDCNECHRVKESKLTTDVLMPVKADCVKCHSPKAKNSVVSDCITCHAYHAPPQVVAADVHANARGAFKEMLLGSNR